MPGFINVVTYETLTSGAKARVLRSSAGTAESRALPRAVPFPENLFMTLDLFIALFAIRLGLFQKLPQAI